MNNFTTLPAVERIVELENDTLRNLQITQSYFELSTALAARLGPCSNWCTFATWASKQAGQTIRQEDMSNGIRQALADAPELGDLLNELIEVAIRKGAALPKDRILELIWDTIDPEAAMQRAGEAVARGNRKVYAEIGKEFARFLAHVEADQAWDETSIQHFCEALAPGAPPEGQQYLRQAFTHYYKAVFETDEKKRAELIFMANLEIGFHEQTRLQPEIAEALGAAVKKPEDFKSQMLDTLFPKSPWLKWVAPVCRFLFQEPTPLDDLLQRFAEQARIHLRRFLTDKMMFLGFPGGANLPLGADLSAGFSPNLRSLKHPELLNLLSGIDPTPDSLLDTGAIDWADLPDRLHFIADLFRCFHDRTDLLLAPFSDEQVAALKNPSGAL